MTVAVVVFPGSNCEHDVAHALKEPTAYESALPGPLIRIGALLTCDASGGVALLCESHDRCATTVADLQYHGHGR